MAILTIDVQETLYASSYTRARVTVYATGKIEQGETGTVTVYDIDRNQLATQEIAPTAQEDGTVEVYSALINFNRASVGTGEGTRACAAYVVAELGSATKEELKALGISKGTLNVAIFPSESGRIEYGEPVKFVVSTNNSSTSARCTIRFRLKYKASGPSATIYQYETVASNATIGVYEGTIPLDWMQYIPEAESITDVYQPASVGGSGYVEKLGTVHVSIDGGSVVGLDIYPTVYVPASYVPTLGDIQYSDGNSHGFPGDGVIDAFVQRLSSVQAWATAEATGYARICKVMCTYGPLSASMGTIQGPAITVPTADSPLVLGTINDSGDLVMTLTVEDSRKRRTTKTVTLKTAAYDYPTVSSINIERWDTVENHSDDESTTVRVRVVGTFTDVNGKGNIGSIKVYAGEAVATPDFELQSTTELQAPAFDKSIDHTGFSETQAWRFKWEVADRFGQMLSGEAIVYGARPIIDVSPDGQSIGFWTTAGGREDINGNPINGFYLNGDLTVDEGKAIYSTGGADENRMDIDKILEFAYNYATQKFQLNALQNIALANDRYLAGYNAADSLIRLLGVNASGQVELNWTSGGLKGRVCKLLWSGVMNEGGSATISELPYYNVFWIACNAHLGFCARRSYDNGAQMNGTCITNTHSNKTDDFNTYVFRCSASGTTFSVEKTAIYNPVTNLYVMSNGYVRAIYGLL